MSRRSRVLLIALGLLLAVPVYARVSPLDAPESRSVVPGTVVLDLHGAVLEHDRSEGLRIPVTLDAVAPRMVQATVSAEDRRFWQHAAVGRVDDHAAARAASLPGGRHRIAAAPEGARGAHRAAARRASFEE